MPERSYRNFVRLFLDEQPLVLGLLDTANISWLNDKFSSQCVMAHGQEKSQMHYVQFSLRVRCVFACFVDLTKNIMW